VSGQSKPVLVNSVTQLTPHYLKMTHYSKENKRITQIVFYNQIERVFWIEDARKILLENEVGVYGFGEVCGESDSELFQSREDTV
jgi:hypothetical protein